MTTVNKDIVLDWLTILTTGPAEAWRDRVADDVVIRLPFAPPGITAEMQGIEQAIAIMSAQWEQFERFDWRDVVICQTEDPEIFLTTARSEVIFRSGIKYANDYIVLTRVRDGKVAEHYEYFNPLAVIEMLNSTKE